MAAKTQRMIVHRRRYRERASGEGGGRAAFQTVTIAVVTALAPSASPPSLSVRPPNERTTKRTAADRTWLGLDRSSASVSLASLVWAVHVRVRPSVSIARAPPAVLGMRVVTTRGGSSRAAAAQSERDGLAAVAAVDHVDAGGGGGGGRGEQEAAAASSPPAQV